MRSCDINCARTPGHGRVTDLAPARAQTQTYLVALRERMKRAVDKGPDPSATARSFDGKAGPAGQRCRSMPGNASRVYLEVGRE